jgi:hypothetical protein
MLGFLSHDARTGTVLDERGRACTIVRRERLTYMAGQQVDHMTCVDPNGMAFRYSIAVYGCEPPRA